MGKLTCKADLNMYREKLIKGVHLHIHPTEKREVLTEVGEVAYVLYDTFRTAPFNEAADITDNALAESLGWAVTKVSRYRRVLEKADYLRIDKGKDGLGEPQFKVMVGRATVALYDANLPANILNHGALNKILRKKGIDLKDISQHIQEVEDFYETHRNDFK